MSSVKMLCVPVADALQIDFKYRKEKLFGEGIIDLDLIPGVPTKFEVKVVDAVVDLTCNTMGMIAHVGGDLYIAIINDERADRMTLFLVSGEKAKFKLNQKTKRLGVLDAKKCHWSRKAFYELIAPGVVATYSKAHYDKTWTKESFGPQAALDYLESRNTTKSAEVINAEFNKKRMKAITGKAK